MNRSSACRERLITIYQCKIMDGPRQNGQIQAAQKGWVAPSLALHDTGSLGYRVLLFFYDISPPV